MTLPENQAPTQQPPENSKPLSFLSKLSAGQKLALGSIAFLLLALPVAVILSLRQVKPESKAALPTTPPVATNPAIVIFSPENTTVTPNESFNIQVDLDTAGNQVTAAEVTIGYSTNLLEIEKVILGPLLPVKLEPVTIDTSTGTGKIRFTVGSKPETPATGTGLLATIKLKAKNQEVKKHPITTIETTRITAIGYDQAILSGQKPAYITIQDSKPPQITPTPTPSPTTGSLTTKISLPKGTNATQAEVHLSRAATNNLPPKVLSTMKIGTITQTTTGIYEITAGNIEPATYLVAIKIPNYLIQDVGPINIKPGVANKISATNTTFTPGDIADNNNKIDIFDYNILVSHFGSRMPAGGSPADLDNDGDVDIFDYNTIVTNFGTTCTYHAGSPGEAGSWSCLPPTRSSGTSSSNQQSPPNPPDLQ